MLNDDLSIIFDEMADMEEIEGRRWQSLAYRKVSANLIAMGGDLREMYRNGRLREIDGVGEAIETKIIQFIETGKIEKYVEMKTKYPIDFVTLKKLQGLGPKKIFALYSKLGVRNIEELKKALDGHKISGLDGFGEKSEESLKKSVATYEKYGANRLFLAKVFPEIMEIKRKLESSALFSRVDIAGSFRRMRETVGDVDILAVSSDPEKATSFFTKVDEVVDIIAKGPAKTTVRLSMGLTCDFRIFDNSSFGAALQYFTGSKDHNVSIREIAISKGMKLNEYGLYKGEDQVAGSDEREVYNKLGLDWIEPELRENMGEIEAAGKRNLPDLVQYGDVKGDLHSHTIETDGKNSLEEMVAAAQLNGLEYLAVTNHSKSLRIANGMNGEQFRKFAGRIDKINDSGKIKLLKGVELEILKDGTLDFEKEFLSEMDFVLAALHQNAGSDIHENTNRVLKVIESGLIHSIAHPTGRLIGSREAFQLDFDKIFEACKSNRVLLEINGYPDRSDLPFDLVKRAKAYDLSFSLGSDSHNIRDLSNIRFAVAIARRGWASSKSIINTLPYDKLMRLLRRM